MSEIFSLGPRINVMTYPTVTVPVRPYLRKKRRMVKKWLKRYGTKTTAAPNIDYYQILHDQERDTFYCYPEGERALRQALREVCREKT